MDNKPDKRTTALRMLHAPRHTNACWASQCRRCVQVSSAEGEVQTVAGVHLEAAQGRSSGRVVARFAGGERVLRNRNSAQKADCNGRERKQLHPAGRPTAAGECIQWKAEINCGVAGRPVAGASVQPRQVRPRKKNARRMFGRPLFQRLVFTGCGYRHHFFCSPHSELVVRRLSSRTNCCSRSGTTKGRPTQMII